MKKMLLSAYLLMISAAVLAETDGCWYPDVDGWTCENLWVLDRVHTPEAYIESGIAVRTALTAAADGEWVYVGDSGDRAVLHRFDLYTGQAGEPLLLTLDGTAFSGEGAVSQVGVDDYGHLYVASYAPDGDGNGCYPLFLVDKETGQLSPAGELEFKEKGVVRHCDVSGDLTGKQSGAVVLAGSGSNLNVFGWRLEAGETAWSGYWDGQPVRQIEETDPEGKTSFLYGTTVHILPEQGNGSRMSGFLLDGYSTFPAWYDENGRLEDSFGQLSPEAEMPAATTNGVAVHELGGDSFLVYSEGQFDVGHKCQAVAGMFDRRQGFASVRQFWMLPADGFGEMPDGGSRVHSLQCCPLASDVNGRRAMLLLTMKCYNGIGVYRIAEAGYSPEAGVVAAEAESSQLVGLFDLSGRRILSENPLQPGIYVRLYLSDGRLKAEKVRR